MIKILNLDLNATNEKRRLSLNELEEIRREAYEHSVEQGESQDIS